MAKEDKDITSAETATELAPLKIDKKAADQALKVEYEAPKPKPKRMYWLGALPATGKTKIQKFNDRGLPDGFEEKTPAAFFYDKNVPMRWMGKCQHFQNIAVGAMEFPAYTEDVTVDGNGEMNRSPFPGAVIKLDEDQVKSILHTSLRRVIREVGERDEDNNSVKRGYYMNCDHKEYVRDVQRDKPLAAYVYMVPINSEEDIPSMKNFFANPPPPLLRD